LGDEDGLFSVMASAGMIQKIHFPSSPQSVRRTVPLVAMQSKWAGLSAGAEIIKDFSYLRLDTQSTPRTAQCDVM